MPLVITINPNSGEVQSDISLLSLCNTWYLRHFPSCCCCAAEIVFCFFLFTCTTCRHVSEDNTTIQTLYCFNVYKYACISFILLVLNLYSLTFPHHTLTETQKSERPDLSSEIQLMWGLQSSRLWIDQVIQGYFLKSVSSHVQKSGDAFGSVTLPAWVAHWQGC